MKTITILLTKYSDFFGRIARGIMDKGYSHASISIDGEETFYSFNYKGFAIEKPKEKYKFAKLGLALCFFKIPNKFKNRFFCSQFVAEILSRAGAVKLKKKTSLYMPTHFINGFECLFSRKQFVYNAV